LLAARKFIKRSKIYRLINKKWAFRTRVVQQSDDFLIFARFVRKLCRQSSAGADAQPQRD
jgi:hypothetical protein